MSIEADIIKKISVFLNTEYSVGLLKDVVKLAAFNAPTMLVEIDRYHQLQYEPTENKFIKAVFTAVSDVTGVSIPNILKDSRKREIVDARKLAVYFVKKGTRLSLSKTAVIFNKDHATIIHNCKGFEALYVTDKAFKHNADRVHTMLAVYGYGEHITEASTHKEFITKHTQLNGQIQSNYERLGHLDPDCQRDGQESGEYQSPDN